MLRNLVARTRNVLLLFVLVCTATGAAAQSQLTGTIVDQETQEPLIGATVIIKNTMYGAYTDLNGKFTVDFDGQLPVTLQVTYVGYDTLSQEVTNLKPLSLSMKEEGGILAPEVEIVGTRITEVLQVSPVQVEKLDIVSIKETPAANFYDALGNLKGVDITAASMGFKVINTRGFNSTTPVRSLQLIDGVDNQAPGLNFSLGNFVGASELDIQNVEIVVGANSTQYGPGAFNGVLKMTTKSPWVHQGLSVMAKFGERSLFDGAVRYAKVFTNKAGKDKFAFKINMAYMKALDWFANSTDPTEQSLRGPGNPGGYDAVNTYGDENLLDAYGNYSEPGSRLFFPGLDIYYRTGYREEDLVDYNTKSFKLQGAAHYKLTDKLELIYGFNYGAGTTVYQGDNRYSLKGLTFMQHKVELNHPNWFFRTYYTTEDAGQSYDAVFTAFLLQERAKRDDGWRTDYANYWQRNILPQLQNQYGYDPNFTGIPADRRVAYVDSILGTVPQEVLQGWHNETRTAVDNNTNNPFNPRARDQAFLAPGTPEFTEAFNQIISQPFKAEGRFVDVNTPSDLTRGSRFLDNSKLWHAMGEYRFKPKFMNINVGANFRLYMPQSYGTIFSDSLINREDPSQGYNEIRVWEYGVYTSLEKTFFEDKLRINAAVRLDQNQNFDPIVSPAASAVYSFNPNSTLRFSFSSAVRNPTLQDQYLFYNVGRAILLGNLNGLGSDFNGTRVATLESIVDYLESPTLNESLIQYTNVNPVKPEKARTIELGYRGVFLKNFFIDAGYYFSFYQDFIGFEFVAEPPLAGQIFQVYRVSTNSKSLVTTQGLSVGLNYYFKKYYAVTGNFSYNELVQTDTADKLIPAFNTPRFKFNLGVNGRDIVMNIGNWSLKNFGFNVNFRWVEGFEFQGSPQFTGSIPTYWTLDAQVNKTIPKWKTTFKVGASNLLNRQYIQAYGGPTIGRMIYVQVTVDAP